MMVMMAMWLFKGMLPVGGLGHTEQARSPVYWGYWAWQPFLGFVEVCGVADTCRGTGRKGAGDEIIECRCHAPPGPERRRPPAWVRPFNAIVWPIVTGNPVMLCMRVCCRGELGNSHMSIHDTKTGGCEGSPPYQASARSIAYKHHGPR